MNKEPFLLRALLFTIGVAVYLAEGIKGAFLSSSVWAFLSFTYLSTPIFTGNWSVVNTFYFYIALFFTCFTKLIEVIQECPSKT